jgi:hypothetical protein
MSAVLNPVGVSFGITFDFIRYYNEGELAAAGSDLLTRLRAAPTLNGNIDISAAGAATTRVIDDLAPWVQNLCYGAVATLAAGKPAQVLYFGRSGLLRLTPVDDKIELSGDLNPTARYPRHALMTALVDCGRRFVAFAERVKRDDADYMANLDYVRQFETAARAALKQEG